MEQSGVVGLSISGDAQRVTDFRDAPFCTKYVLAQLLGMEQITEDVVRGWIESRALAIVEMGANPIRHWHCCNTPLRGIRYNGYRQAREVAPMPSPSLQAKKAYCAKARQSNYAASLRLEGFQVTTADAERNIKDAGVERFFYSKTTESHLDDIITDEEPMFDQLLLQLREGIIKDKSLISEMIAHFEIRNKSLRSNMFQIGSSFYDGLERVLSDKSYVRRLVEKIISPSSKAFQTALQEKGITPELLSILLKQQPNIIKNIQQQAAESFSGLLDNLDRQEVFKLAKNAHIKAMTENLSPRAKVEQYSKLSYRVITRPSSDLPLGDTIVFFETDRKQKYTNFLQKGDELLSVIMPLSPSQYLIGTPRENLTIIDEELPSLIASTSYSFILAPYSDDSFKDLIPEIGTMGSIFSHEDIEGIFEESFLDFINSQ